MPHARSLPLIALAVLVPSLAGCPAPDQQPAQPQGQWGQAGPPGQYPALGQYAPPGQYGPGGQPPMSQPIQPGPGQWVPPPQPSGPFGWWPQGSIPVPAVGPVPIPGVPALPGMPMGAPQQCVDTINQYRARHGVPPVSRWMQAEPCAAHQAQTDAMSGQPHGSFGRCGEAAQNVCPGWQGSPESMTGSCLASMYSEGPGQDYARHGHYLNMMSPRFTRVACGYFTTPQGQVWAVHDFQ